MSYYLNFFERLQFISENKYIENITPENLDLMLSKAWRRFGHNFFRYNLGFVPDLQVYSLVIPLRIRLIDFEFSKSQKKIFKKNAPFDVKKGLIRLNDKKYTLFELHRQRFRYNPPSSLYEFISPEAESNPIPTYEISVFDTNKLIAASFVDNSTNALSSIYAMFDTQYSPYSLGNYTLFEEIIWAKELGKKYLYLGYAYEAPSFYDYKKRFSALEAYLWEEDKWTDFEGKASL